MKKFILFLFLLQAPLLFSQNTGCIKCLLNDFETKEAIPFSNIELKKDSAGKTIIFLVSTTNMDGECFFKNVPTGKYQARGIYVGYTPKLITDIIVEKGVEIFVDLSLKSIKDNLQETQVIKYVPIPKPQPKYPQTVTSETYQDVLTTEPKTRICSPDREYSPDHKYDTLLKTNPQKPK